MLKIYIKVLGLSISWGRGHGLRIFVLIFYFEGFMLKF